MTDSKHYIIAQSPASGARRAYLCAWVGGDGWVRDGIHEIPVFLYERDQALTFDEATARQLAGRFDDRYRRVVRHHVEELP